MAYYRLDCCNRVHLIKPRTIFINQKERWYDLLLRVRSVSNFKLGLFSCKSKPEFALKDKQWTQGSWTLILDRSIDHLYGPVHGPPIWTWYMDLYDGPLIWTRSTDPLFVLPPPAPKKKKRKRDSWRTKSHTPKTKTKQKKKTSLHCRSLT